jgi:S1-C subfamily serine protease
MHMFVRTSALMFVLCSIISVHAAAPATMPAATVNVETPGTSKFVKSCVRLRMKTEDTEFVTTGFGSAFGIDLKMYGLKQPRYVLTAAHMVMNKNGIGLANGELAIEIPNKRISRWAKCAIVAVDTDRDLCLLECETDVPVMCKLNTDDDAVQVDSAVLVVGCPSGVPPQLSYGWLTDKNPRVKGVMWQAAANFYHGNSGGPVFDADKGNVIGVAVAGIPDGKGDMDRKVAMFTPYFEVKKFLDKAVETKVHLR